MNTEANFHVKTKPLPNGCILWTGTISGYGYGIFYQNYKALVAHRYAFELAKGPIPTGLQLDHLCRNRACVNPNHLEPVTPRINCLRGESIQAHNSRKTHCIRGHEFTPRNTRYRGTWRICRECVRLDSRQRYATKRGTQ